MIKVMFDKTGVKISLAAAVLFSIGLSLIVRAQNLVPIDEITEGSSVFVFRTSRKRPQKRLAAADVSVLNRIDRRIPSARNRRNWRANAARRKTVRTANNRAQLAKNRAAARRKAAGKIRLSETLAVRGETHLKNKQYDQSIAAFRRALKENPKNANASDGLSEALTEKGGEIVAAADGTTNGAGKEAAIPFFEEAVRLNSKNADAFANLAEIYEADGQSSKAIENYEKALAAAAEMTELYASIGLLHVGRGEIPQAEKYVERAEQTNPNDARTQYLRGMYFYLINKNEAALDAFGKTLALDAQNTNAHFYRALIYERLNQNDLAIAANQKAVEIEPSFAEGWFDLGVAYYNAEQYKEAENAYRRALALEPENAQAHANLASVLRQQERFAEANGEYKLAAVKIKNDPDLFSEWGFCLGKVKDWTKAVERLSTVRELSPDAIDFNNLGWGYFNGARAAEDAKNQAEANRQYALGRAALEKAVELNPRFAAAQYNLGATLNALKEFQAATPVLKTAVSLKPNWVLAINELGMSYRGAKNLKAAVEEFKRAISLDAKFAPALYNLGETERARGNKKEARRIQTRLKQLDPALAEKLGDIIDK